MKKLNKRTLAALFLSVTLTACQKVSDLKNVSDTSAPQISETTTPENTSEPHSGTEPQPEESSAETEASAEEKRGLPEGIVLSITDGLTVSEKPDQVTYGEDGVWFSASFEDFIYASEPFESEFKKYGIGDTICGLALRSASFNFINMYMDNEYHDGGCRINSYASFNGTLTLTGTLSIAEEDGANTLIKKNDILFTPDEAVFPRMGGFYEGENLYMVFCGNLNDEELCEDVKALAPGAAVRVEAVLSDISLIVERGVPVSGRAYCKIDGFELLYSKRQ